MIIVDTNERDTVVKHLTIKNYKYSMKKIEIDNEGCADYTNENMDFLVERKTVSDYVSSLLSHHLMVQLGRMTELFDGPKYLIIEGDLEEYLKMLDKNIRAFARSFLNKTTHIYNVCLRQVWTAEETADLLIELDKYAKDIKDPPIYFEAIYTRKTKDKRIQNIMTVPRLGERMAIILLEKYKTINKLTETCKYNPKDVMDVEGVGKITVENIVNMYYGDKPYEKKKRESQSNNSRKKFYAIHNGDNHG